MRHTSLRLDREEAGMLDELMSMLGLSASSVLRLVLRRLFTSMTQPQKEAVR